MGWDRLRRRQDEKRADARVLAGMAASLDGGRGRASQLGARVGDIWRRQLPAQPVQPSRSRRGGAGPAGRRRDVSDPPGARGDGPRHSARAPLPPAGYRPRRACRPVGSQPNHCRGHCNRWNRSV